MPPSSIMITGAKANARDDIVDCYGVRLYARLFMRSIGAGTRDKEEEDEEEDEEE
jgi:hypothetical protein